MAIYKTETIEINRPYVTSRDLRLGFELSDEFCTAAWNALDNPVKIAVAAQNQPEGRGIEHAPIQMTGLLKKAFLGILTNTLFNEARRLNVETPDVLRDNENMDRLLAACITHDHCAYGVFYKPHDPYNPQ